MAQTDPRLTALILRFLAEDAAVGSQRCDRMRRHVALNLAVIGVWLLSGTFGRLSLGQPNIEVNGKFTEHTSDWQRFEHQARHMGTLFRMTVYATDAAIAEQAIAEANQRIRQLDETLSDYRSDSELIRLASQTSPARVSDDLFRVLTTAQQVSRLSHGAFDITVGPLSRLWRRVRRTGRWPEAARIAEARAAVGHDRLRLSGDPPTAQLTRSGMRLDAGGIAKGDALDQARAVFDSHGLRRVLIDGGGDVIVGDPPPGKRHWRIAVAGLQRDAEHRLWLQLSNQAVASSGDLFQFMEHDGVRYSHIVDPRTGKGVTRRSVATVIAARGIVADAWASALSVLGPDEIELVGEHVSAARLLINKPDDNGRDGLRETISSRWSEHLESN